MTSTSVELSATELDHFRRDGFLVRRGQLSSTEVTELCDHFAAIRAANAHPESFQLQEAADPLAQWPRMMHPHRFDARSLELLLDARLMGVAAALYRRPCLAAQSMWYWKPPGARGQALHQDDFYLRTQPGECLAAWVALDPSREDNGGLRVVPASHLGALQCPHEADATQSFSSHEVDLPPAAQPVALDLGAGDILFFGGKLIHGSPPNSSDRWRRSFICHYVPEDAAECARGYHPLLNALGEVVSRADAGPDSDPCGGREFALLGTA